MRRLFVIFLILLFPLNVFALSMSVSSMQPAGAAEQVTGAVAGSAAAAFSTPDAPLFGDLDPDEPPAGMDFHDSVNLAGRLQWTVLPGGTVCAPPPSRYGLAPCPPIKPPPVH